MTNGVNPYFFNRGSVAEIVKNAVINAAINPTAVCISSAVVSPAGSLINFKLSNTAAAPIAGIPKINAVSTASSNESFRVSAPTIVIPDRDTPGITEIA